MRNGLWRRGAGRHEMRTSNPDRLTRATTEQLLDGGPGPAGLQQLLSAAAGPGTESELRGETAAVAAFVDAPRASPLPSASTRRPSMLNTVLSKILAAKALAALVLLAGATGGVALAATVSSPSSTPSDDVPAATASMTATPAPSENSESESEKAEETDETAAAKPGRTASPSPQPSLDGLCKAWAAGATENRGKAAENPAFGSLIEAAGSPDDVPGYCAARAYDNENGRAGRVTQAPAPSAEEPAASPGRGRGVPPTAAPGNPDRPAGPPADGEKKNADKQENNKKKDDEKNDDKKDDDKKGGGQQNKGANSKSDDAPGADRRPN